MTEIEALCRELFIVYFEQLLTVRCSHLLQDDAVAALLFDRVCNGEMDLSWLPFNSRAEMNTVPKPYGLPQTEINTASPAFMIVRNKCLNPVTVIVSQDVSVHFIMHISTLLSIRSAALTFLGAFVLVFLFWRLAVNVRSYICFPTRPFSNSKETVLGYFDPLSV